MPSLFFRAPIYQVNILLYEDVLKTSSRCLSSWSSVDVFKMSWRRFTKTNIFTLLIHLQNVLTKTSIFVLAIRLQDVFKTFSRHLQKFLQKRIQYILKTSWRCFEDVFKTTSRRLAKISLRRFQGVSSI